MSSRLRVFLFGAISLVVAAALAFLGRARPIARNDGSGSQKSTMFVPSINLSPAYDEQAVMDACSSISDKYAKGGFSAATDVLRRIVRGRGMRGPEIRGVLRAFLEHPDIRMRFNAAKYLFEAGGVEGRQTLIAIMKSSSPVYGGGDDIRVRAAECLMSFRDRESLGELLAYKSEGDGNPLLKALFLKFGDVMDPRYAILAKAELLELGAREFGKSQEVLDARMLQERARLILGADVSEMIAKAKTKGEIERIQGYSDYGKDMAAWVLALDGNSPEALARLVESGKKEVSGVLPGYSGRTEVLKMLGTIDRPESTEVLVMGLKEQRTATICALNLLFCQSEGYGPVRQMLLDELSIEKDPGSRVLSYEMKWKLAALMSDDPVVSAAARAADERAGLGDWDHYVVQRRDWPVYTWSSGSVYWYRRTKVEPR